MGIFNDTITRRYLTYKGETPSKAWRMDLSPIIHFFFMDCIRNMFERFDPMPLSNYNNKLKGKWKKAMKDFDDRFWIPFKGKGEFKSEMQNFIIDKLDAYQQYIKHDIDIALLAWEESCNDLPEETRKYFSAAWLANRLAFNAQGAHAVQYKTRSGDGMIDKEIGCVQKSTQDICLNAFPQDMVSVRKIKRIELAADVIANKTKAWLIVDSEEDERRVTEYVEAKKAKLAPSQEAIDQLKNKFQSH